jgi:hypothetical protein
MKNPRAATAFVARPRAGIDMAQIWRIDDASMQAHTPERLQAKVARIGVQ